MSSRASKFLLAYLASVQLNVLLSDFKTEASFSQTHVSTIGIDFKTKLFNVGNREVKLQIWDTAGQERFRSFTSTSYRAIHGAIFVFDISTKKTFSNLKSWMDEIQSNARQNVIKIIVGNKSDLDEQREVSASEAKVFADSMGCPYFETSAKTNRDVDHIFEQMALSLVENYPVVTKNENELEGNLMENLQSNPNEQTSSQRKSSFCCRHL